MKTILITGIGDTRNNGCWAMLASAIAAIRNATPTPVRFVILNRKGTLDRERLPFPDLEFIHRPWSLVSRPGLRLPWILFCFTLIWLQSRLRLPVRILFSAYWRTFNQADLVLDLSGDSISRDYSWVANLTVSLPLMTARNLGIPFFLCAQSIGPFDGGRLDSFILGLLKDATLITTREDLSLHLLASHGIISRVHRTQDLAFLLPPAAEASLQASLKQEGIDPSFPWVGLSVSSIIAGYAFSELPPEQREARYLSDMAFFADHLVENYGLKVLFIPHVVIPGIADDRIATDQVVALMRRREDAKVICGGHTADVLKGIIGICRFFVGSRMHATIGALSQSIPTLTLVYNHKTIGINGTTLGQEDFLLDLRELRSEEFLQECIRIFAEMFRRESDIRKVLTLRLPNIKNGARANGWLAVNLMNAAGPLGDMDDPRQCTGCGTCVGSCPHRTLGMEETLDGTLRPTAVGDCRSCGLCSKVCPALGMNLSEEETSFFSGAMSDPEAGVAPSAWIGHSKSPEIRRDASSGGAVSEIASALLEEGQIDAVLLTNRGKEGCLDCAGQWATTRAEVLQARGSRYLPAPLNTAFTSIPHGARRLAVVGLPCHLWGIQRLSQSGLLGDKTIDFRIGLFCGRTPTFHAVDALLEVFGIRRDELLRLSFRGRGWPGTAIIETRSRTIELTLDELWSFIGTPWFTPAHCFLCPDFFARLCDVSCGDAWLPQVPRGNDGWSLLLPRTDKGWEILDRLSSDGALHLEETDLDTVKKSFRANGKRKASYQGLKKKACGIPCRVTLDNPEPDNALFYPFFYIEAILARIGRSPVWRQKLINYPPTLFMRVARRLSSRMLRSLR